VTILVGQDDKQKQFTVHEDLLRTRSKYFDACLKGNPNVGTWIESEDRVVRLPDDEPEVFALYTQSLYVSIHLFRIDFDPSYWVKLCKLFAFCDMRLDDKCKAIVAQAIYA
ncbi:hypothetical protein BS50DRAFT_457197, partial [Corynespora cassiicola Philippines]